MVDEIFDIFDENNRFIGQASRSDVHAQGMYHRAVHILLFGADGRLLIQRRANDKDICPDFWDLSVAEHLKPGESTIQAALRGLEEELGILANAAPELSLWRPYRLQTQIDTKSGIRDCEFVETYLGNYNGPIKMNAAEVASISYQTKDELLSNISRTPQIFTPWLLNEIHFLIKNKGAW